MIRELLIPFLAGYLDVRTDRKLLVFESDDWGSLYLPDNRSIRPLEQAGILPTDRKGYLRFDCLETRADLEALFDTLSHFSDFKSRPVKFTFNTVLGNPDFEKIRDADFQEYRFQHFFDSYREHNGEDCQDLWRKGICDGLFTPQFHAREHINVPRWMSDLKQGRKDTRFAFEHKCYCQDRSALPPVGYLTAHWPDSLIQLQEIERITCEGLNIFHSTFGFNSVSFVACSYVLPEEIEKSTSNQGVKLIQTQRRHRVPIIGKNASRFRSRYSGQINPWGQTYSVRNVVFEPSSDESIDWVKLAFKQIEKAFKKKKPAVVSTHRVNYVGGRDLRNRDRTLSLLRSLLKKVTTAFGDIEFVSTNELIPVLTSKNSKSDAKQLPEEK